MNLIICTTPFQVLLAERIVEMNPNEEYIFRFISTIRNEKTNYYFNKLKKKIKDSEFIYVGFRNRFEFVLLHIKYRLKNLFEKEYNKVRKIILASVDNSYVHVYIHNIIQKNKSIIIETFDDGTANLDKNSFFYQETSFSKKTYLIKCFLFCHNTTMNVLKSKYHKHYSIYKDKPNIIENVEYVRLYNIEHKIANNNSPIIKNGRNKMRLFVGQPIYEMDHTKKYGIAEHANFINHLISNLNIDYFFPHPREKNFLTEKNKYINSIKIFEDFFFEEYSPDIQYTVYTFFSGSVLSIGHLPNIQIYLIKIKDFPTDLGHIYEMMKINFNLPTIEIISN